eukprot:3349073-Prymnesium_polylepis.1
MLTYPHGWDVSAGWLNADDAPPADSLVVHRVPNAAALQLRAWRAGDRFEPVWRRGGVSVSAFLRGQR